MHNRYLQVCIAKSVMVAFCALGCAQDSATQTANIQATSTDSSSSSSQSASLVVPDTDQPEKLRDFILSALARQASSREEYLQIHSAVKSAAQKGLASVSDANTPTAQEFEKWFVNSSVVLLASADAKERHEITQRLLKYLGNTDKPTSEDLQLVLMAGQTLEQLDELEVAKQAYRDSLAIVESKRGDEYAPWIGMLRGSLNRLDSLGKVVEFKSKTLAGEDFDIESLRGKFVLLHFWSTWDRVTPNDLPNLEHTYKTYHDSGLQIVSISMDTQRKELEAFVSERKIPWLVIWNEGENWQESIVRKFGINAIPTSMLIDPEGKVIHLEARGAALTKLLDEKLTKPTPTEPAPAETK